ncbi:hypothetical protein PIIN_05879 [Serendipita indica DSM 11827]|uniref:Uncharacterized protein n=1 Tax=Serendipita indica (strain DSM 11827) TaxID=1109443 RepID=G4TKV1_SERID|nr:hypothetical protein PIIN_05879 [Serendipita indica DSM 11827]
MRGFLLIITFAASAILTAGAPIPEPQINFETLVPRTDTALKALEEKHASHHAAWQSWAKDYRHAQDKENTHRDHKEDALRKGPAYAESAKHHGEGGEKVA